MSRNQRIGLVVVALAVAVVAFVIAQPGDDEDSKTTAADTTPDQNESHNQTHTHAKTEYAPPPEPEVARISVKGGVVAGDVQSIEVAKGDMVRIVVSSDAPDEIHLHGYDIEKEAEPGKPARFRFEADVEGAFELESHTAEHAGNEPLIARLLVGPS